MTASKEWVLTLMQAMNADQENQVTTECVSYSAYPTYDVCIELSTNCSAGLVAKTAAWLCNAVVQCIEQCQ